MFLMDTAQTGAMSPLSSANVFHGRVSRGTRRCVFMAFSPRTMSSAPVRQANRQAQQHSVMYAMRLRAAVPQVTPCASFETFYTAGSCRALARAFQASAAHRR